jgi:uncharacterized protein YgbK (DUF1537 family)
MMSMADRFAQIRTAVTASRRVVVALDDDPTGVQTVYDTPVLTVWDAETLAAELRTPSDDGVVPPPLVFILTNSRALPASEAIGVNREIVRNLRWAVADVNAARSPDEPIDVVVASRSDSTLRGHFPAEPDAIADELGGIDGVLIVPAFFEGGRVTIDDVHYLRDGDVLVPVAETEFSRDATFGYRHSNLREWVEEKTGGRVHAVDVASLSLTSIREGGPEAVRERLLALRHGQPAIVNAESYDDLATVVSGVLAAEAVGRRFVYRTAASFVRARVGLGDRPLLSRADLLGGQAPPCLAGLVVVGSHVRRSGEQLAALLELPDVVGIELSVPEVLASETSREAAVARTREAAGAALRAGLTPVIYTSRTVTQVGSGEGQLAVSQAVSAALVAVVQGLEERPGYIVGKGGITASDLGTHGLGARRALVLGQIRPGVPVWRLGPETRYPGLPYVVFPGNVGTSETLAEIVAELRGATGVRR